MPIPYALTHMDCFNRDPHFQRVMPFDRFFGDYMLPEASIGTLIFRG